MKHQLQSNLEDVERKERTIYNPDEGSCLHDLLLHVHQLVVRRVYLEDCVEQNDECAEGAEGLAVDKTVQGSLAVWLLQRETPVHESDESGVLHQRVQASFREPVMPGTLAVRSPQGHARQARAPGTWRGGAGRGRDGMHPGVVELCTVLLPAERAPGPEGVLAVLPQWPLQVRDLLGHGLCRRSVQGSAHLEPVCRVRDGGRPVWHPAVNGEVDRRAGGDLRLLDLVSHGVDQRLLHTSVDVVLYELLLLAEMRLQDTL
mmetsp:Transcript_68477/g.155145  ORF Transcript_68477/g.155145 Transcript_68477/m.155145 type:complete len:260 (+) Transcript_68477:1305-2084(+)